jgi:formylglycine-generating enzyme required for sulfatase activity
MKQSCIPAIVSVILLAALILAACPNPESSGGETYQVRIGELAHGTITARPQSGAEGTEISLTVTPDEGYRLLPGSLKFRRGDQETLINTVSGTFRLPPGDVTVTGEFEGAYRVIIPESLGAWVTATPSGGPEGTEISLTISPAPGFRLTPASLRYSDGYEESPVNPGTKTFILPASNVTLSASFESMEDFILKMVSIPGGTVPPVDDPKSFFAGAPVTVDPFSIAAAELSYGLWYRVKAWAESPARGTKRYYFPPGKAGPGIQGTGGHDEPTEDNAYNPVCGLGWWDAVVWCNAYSEWAAAEQGKPYAPVYKTVHGKVLRSALEEDTEVELYNIISEPAPNAPGYRLPTAREWEFAARGANPRSPAWNYPFAGSDRALDVAWYVDNSGLQVRTVGTLAPNALGIHDMSGNAPELVGDRIPLNPGNTSACYVFNSHVHGPLDAVGITASITVKRGSSTVINELSAIQEGFRVAGPYEAGQ